MPPKRKKKPRKVQLNNKGVTQVVHVNVSKVVKNKNKVVPQNPFSKQPINSFSLISPQMSTPSYQNEYNLLLKELTAERKQMLNSLPQLAPNTAPLTSNLQRNELFQTPYRPPFSALTDSFSKSAEETVKHETYDNPQTDDNNLANSAGLQENVAQSLAVESPSVASASEQTPNTHQTVDTQVQFRNNARANRTYEAKRGMHARYVELVQQVNKQYQLNIPIRKISKFNNIQEIYDEINNVQNEIGYFT
jgi:hypothetical protein